MGIKTSYDWSSRPAYPFTDGVIGMFRGQVILPITGYYLAKSGLDHSGGFEFHRDRKWQRIRALLSCSGRRRAAAAPPPRRRRRRRR